MMQNTFVINILSYRIDIIKTETSVATCFIVTNSVLSVEILWVVSYREKHIGIHVLPLKFGGCGNKTWTDVLQMIEILFFNIALL